MVTKIPCSRSDHVSHCKSEMYSLWSDNNYKSHIGEITKVPQNRSNPGLIAGTATSPTNKELVKWLSGNGNRKSARKFKTLIRIGL